MDKLSISIGIPAFNEEANITKLLKSILGQSCGNFILREIIVVSDASKDQTVFRVRELNSPIIKLVENPERRGQVYSQNLIFKRASENIIVIFEADTEIYGIHYLEEMVRSFLADQSIALLQGNLRPLGGENLVGRILCKQSEIYHEFILARPDLLSYFSSGRGGRLFNKKALKDFFWPINVPEDSYALLWCDKNGKKTDFCLQAICFYKSPQNFKDFASQWKKILSGPEALRLYFSKTEIQKIYKRSFFEKLNMFFRFLISDPFFCAGYLVLKLRMLNVLTKQPFADDWEIAVTTKSV